MRGNELKQLREQRGVKAAWMAKRLGLPHRQQVTKIEQKKDVSVSEFVAYVNALDLKPGDLLENSAWLVTPETRPLLEVARKLRPETMKRALRIVEEIAAIAGDDDQHRPADVVPIKRGIRITLSDEERDELSEAMYQASQGKLSPRSLGRSDVSVPMLATVAADPKGKVSFKRMYETRDINSYHWERGVRSLMKVEGDSMLDMGIVTGDLLYIRPTDAPHQDRAVVCTVGNVFYVKVFSQRDDGAIVLSSRHKSMGYPDIVIRRENLATFNYLGEVFGRYGDL